MREKDLEILCCPVCRSDLRLKAAKKDGEDIMEGSLICKGCGREYRIKDGIVDMAP